MKFLRSLSILFALFVVAAGQAKPAEEHDSIPQDLEPALFGEEPMIEPPVHPEKIPSGYTHSPIEMELPEPKIPEVPEIHYYPKEHMDVDYPANEIEPMKLLSVPTRLYGAPPQARNPAMDGKEFGSADHYHNYHYFDDPMYAEHTLPEPLHEEIILDSPPIQHHEMASGPEFSAEPITNTMTHEHSVETVENDLLASLEIGICGEVTCRTPFKERVKSWMCEYTKYTVELITWIGEFEEWWHGCEESQMDGAAVWPNPIQCPDVSLVKCVDTNKKLCADDRIGCTRCVCKDGMYAEAPKLLKLWKKEVEAFKGRFEVYKTKIGTCTRLPSYECDVEDPPESVGSGSGEDVIIPDERDMDGSGEESGSGEEDMIPDERDIESGSGNQSGSGERMTDPDKEEREVGSGEQSGSGEEMTVPDVEERDVESGEQSGSGSGEEMTDSKEQDRSVQPGEDSRNEAAEVERTTVRSSGLSDHTTRAKQESATTAGSKEYEPEATTPSGGEGKQPEDDAELSERTTVRLPVGVTERDTEPSATGAEHQAESTTDSMEYESTTDESAGMAEDTTEASDTSVNQQSASTASSVENESTTEGDEAIGLGGVAPSLGLGAAEQ